MTIEAPHPMAAIRAKARALVAKKPKTKPNGNGKFLDGVHVQKEDQATVELGCAANIKPEPIIWLWKDWLALGKLHILAGQPGVGKSTIALKIAGAVSYGFRLIDSTLKGIHTALRSR